MHSETAQMLTALAQQTQLLSQILDQFKQPKLGLGDAPSTLWIYANRSNNCPWYTIRDGEVSPVQQSALTGYLEELKFEKVERRGKEMIKLQTFIKGDRPYCIESGFESHFSKGLLSAIAAMTPEQLKQPITIVPQPGTDEAVLFCRVFINSEPVRATYDEQTDWRAISQSALGNVNGDVRAIERKPEPAIAASQVKTVTPKRVAPIKQPELDEEGTGTWGDDLSPVIASVGTEIERIGWTKKQGSSYLQQTYSKKTRAELTENELLEFYEYLETLPDKGVANSFAASEAIALN